MICMGSGRRKGYLAAIRRLSIREFYVIFTNAIYNAIEPFTGFNQKLYLLIVRIWKGRVLRWQERGSSSSAEFFGPREADRRILPWMRHGIPWTREVLPKNSIQEGRMDLRGPKICTP